MFQDILGYGELAFFMGCGLLIDAFLVRTLLVPSLIALVAPIGGWPGGRLRAPAAPPAPAPATSPPASPLRTSRLAQVAVLVGFLAGIRAALSGRRR